MQAKIFTLVALLLLGAEVSATEASKTKKVAKRVGKVFKVAGAITYRLGQAASVGLMNYGAAASQSGYYVPPAPVAAPRSSIHNYSVNGETVTVQQLY